METAFNVGTVEVKVHATEEQGDVAMVVKTNGLKTHASVCNIHRTESIMICNFPKFKNTKKSFIS